MQFGIFFGLEVPRPWYEGREHLLFREALEQAELADDLGFGFAWAMEHHFLEEYSHSSAPEAFLAACSQRTKTIRLGHGIVLMPPAYNNPARVAERIATLDLLSDGRVEWGVGSSSSRMELEAFGIPFDEKHEMCSEATREAARMMASTPYGAFNGKYFSMPTRNVVPKPLQKPHPPLWLACTNRETVRIAAQQGVGALTFGFLEPAEGKFWVDEYYNTFEEECIPLGRAVNPNIAMVSSLMCHGDQEIAVERGLDGWEFFKYALFHYYLTGTHIPGRSNLWEDFQRNKPEPRFTVGGIGDPKHVRDNMAMFEEIGLDQVIFIQQGGNNRHDHVCESLELLAKAVLPEFRDRHSKLAAEKAERLAPYIERAMDRLEPLPEAAHVTEVESYPVLAKKRAARKSSLPPIIAFRDSLTPVTLSATRMEFRLEDSVVMMVESNAVQELIPVLIRELDGSRPWAPVVDELDDVAAPEVVTQCLQQLFDEGVFVDATA